MGWCRCTYRNCTVRSDGVTHMFHYPVFDKARCQQWLMNSQRTDFLDLKLCQLKNRIVCQHHFKDECFMNYKKEKLTIHAVPTEDGPYCSSKKCLEEDYSLSLPVSNLESEQLDHNQKMASFKVKYRDFLINYDTLDLDYQALELNLDGKKVNWSKEKPKLLALKTKTEYSEDINAPLNSQVVVPVSQKTIPDIDGKKLNWSKKKPQLLGPKTETQYSEDINAPLISQAVVPVSQKAIPDSGSENMNSNISNSQIVIHRKSKQNNGVENINPNNVDRNRQPLVIIHKVESITFDNNSYKKEKLIDQSPYNVQKVSKDVSEGQIDDTSFINMLSVQGLKQHEQFVNNHEVPTLETEPVKKNNNSLLKSQSSMSGKSVKMKLSPFECAKIEEKRRFNRTKLKDMMELKEFDKQGKHLKTTQNEILNSNDIQASKNYNLNVCHDSQTNNQLHQRDRVKTMGTEKDSQFLSKNLSLPTVNDYTVASLANKLQRMEDILLNKIDQNARRINELKTIVEPKPLTVKKHSAVTQTNIADYKKYLFDEISVFLKSETKSQIYEELFLNKISVNNACRRSPVKRLQSAKRGKRLR